MNELHKNLTNEESAILDVFNLVFEKSKALRFKITKTEIESVTGINRHRLPTALKSLSEKLSTLLSIDGNLITLSEKFAEAMQGNSFPTDYPSVLLKVHNPRIGKDNYLLRFILTGAKSRHFKETKNRFSFATLTANISPMTLGEMKKTLDDFRFAYRIEVNKKGGHSLVVTSFPPSEEFSIKYTAEDWFDAEKATDENPVSLSDTLRKIDQLKSLPKTMPTTREEEPVDDQEVIDAVAMEEETIHPSRPAQEPTYAEEKHQKDSSMEESSEDVLDELFKEEEKEEQLGEEDEIKDVLGEVEVVPPPKVETKSNRPLTLAVARDAFHLGYFFWSLHDYSFEVNPIKVATGVLEKNGYDAKDFKTIAQSLTLKKDFSPAGFEFDMRSKKTIVQLSDSEFIGIVNGRFVGTESGYPARTYQAMSKTLDWLLGQDGRYAKFSLHVLDGDLITSRVKKLLPNVA